MILPLVLVIAILVFTVQLLLCFKARKAWLRLSPLVLSAVCDGFCWIVFLSAKLLDMEDFLGMAAAIFAFILVYWVAAALMAWVLYGIVKTIQKRRK